MKIQLKSLQDSCLSMINLGMTKQVSVLDRSLHAPCSDHLSQSTVMNIIMQRFAVVTMIFAPLTLLTGFFGELQNVALAKIISLCNSLARRRLACAKSFLYFAGMNVPIPGPSMNIDETDG